MDVGAWGKVRKRDISQKLTALRLLLTSGATVVRVGAHFVADQ